MNDEKRDRRGEPPEFWKRRRRVFETKLPTAHKLYLLAMVDYCGDDGEGFPSNAQMAEDLSMSDRQVRSIAGDLIGVGAINRFQGLKPTLNIEIRWDVITPTLFIPGKGQNSQRGRKYTSTPNRAEEHFHPPGSTLPPSPEEHFHPGRKYTSTGTQREHKGNASKNTKGDSEGSKPGKFDPRKVALPLTLNTPAFRESWVEWCDARAEMRKPLSRRAVDKQLKLLARFTESEAIAAIDSSIASTHQGLFPKKLARNGQSGPFTHGATAQLLRGAS